jgi:hypothetical protein
MFSVTPEIATMAWPVATQLWAIDRCDAMIGTVWPRDIAGRRIGVRAEWLETHVIPRDYRASITPHVSERCVCIRASSDTVLDR